MVPIDGSPRRARATRRSRAGRERRPGPVVASDLRREHGAGEREGVEQHDRSAGTCPRRPDPSARPRPLRRHGDVGEGGDRPVGVRIRRLDRPRAGHRRGPTGCEPGHHLVEHALGVAHPQVLGTLDRDDLRLGHPGEAFARRKVDRRSRRTPGPARRGDGRRRPMRRDRRRCSSAVAGRAGSPHDDRIEAVPQRQVGAERPGQEPHLRQVVVLGVLEGRGEVVRSPSPASNSPSLVPCRLLVPRLLKRSTARSASAGGRQAALRNRWLSIMPPCVGSGWRQTRVAIRLCSGGNATSPTSARPSEVCRVSASRRAGRTVLPRMRGLRGHDAVEPIHALWPAWAVSPWSAAVPVVPAGCVPVPPLLRTPPVSVPPSTGQVTTCGVAGGISWSQPGHR